MQRPKEASFFSSFNLRLLPSEHDIGERLFNNGVVASLEGTPNGSLRIIGYAKCQRQGREKICGADRIVETGFEPSVLCAHCPRRPKRKIP